MRNMEIIAGPMAAHIKFPTIFFFFTDNMYYSYSPDASVRAINIYIMIWLILYMTVFLIYKT